MARLEIIENDIGIIERGDTLYLDTKFREDKSNVDPSSVTVTITYPCSSGSDSVSMVTTPTTGRWEADWAVPSDATYGIYEIEYSASYDSKTYKFKSLFYVLPWNMTQQIRSVSGVKQSNDISDNDLAAISWNAYLEAKEEVFKNIIDERVKQKCNYYFDGDNTTFYTQRRRVVDGYNACDEDNITGFYKTNDGDLETINASIIDASNGKVKLTTDGITAIPSTQCGVYISYRIHTSRFQDHLFRKAVTYLASHEVVLKFHELDKATLADLDTNRPVILANPDRMKKKYKESLNKIKFRSYGGVQL